MNKGILLSLILFIGSCKTGPDIAVCLLDPANDVLRCSKDGNAFIIPFKEAENYIAIQPDDFKKVLDYCKMNQEGQQQK